jgi:hypothetical protein
VGPIHGHVAASLIHREVKTLADGFDDATSPPPL